MGVSKKRRRKIICNGIEYIWYISQDCDSIYYILNIISKDKTTILSYPLQTETSYVICKGSYFQGMKTDGRWNRYIVPFSIIGAVTPKFVSKITDWAVNGTNAVKIEWNGKDIII